MKSFLVLLILFACGVAGYEYFQHQQQAKAYVDARAQYGPSIAKMKADNQSLISEQAQLTTKLTALQNQEADLKSQGGSTDPASVTPPPPATPMPAGASPMLTPGAAPKP